MSAKHEPVEVRPILRPPIQKALNTREKEVYKRFADQSIKAAEEYLKKCDTYKSLHDQVGDDKDIATAALAELKCQYLQAREAIEDKCGEELELLRRMRDILLFSDEDAAGEPWG